MQASNVRHLRRPRWDSVEIHRAAAVLEVLRDAPEQQEESGRALSFSFVVLTFLLGAVLGIIGNKLWVQMGHLDYEGLFEILYNSQQQLWLWLKQNL